MNKGTIIEDAITYIKELQSNVKDLSDQLLEMEAYPEEEAKQSSRTLDAAEEMNTFGIQVVHSKWFCVPLICKTYRFFRND